MDKQELIVIVVVFAVVLAASFALTTWLNSQNNYFFGFKVFADESSFDAVKSVFAKNNTLLLRQELINGSSPSNTAVGAASAELVYASLSVGKKIYNYGAVNGVAVQSSCTLNNSFCGTPDIIIRSDSSTSPCNCIYIRNGDNGKVMEIVGSADFLLGNAVNLRKMVFAVNSNNSG